MEFGNKKKKYTEGKNGVYSGNTLPGVETVRRASASARLEAGQEVAVADLEPQPARPAPGPGVPLHRAAADLLRVNAARAGALRPGRPLGHDAVVLCNARVRDSVRTVSQIHRRAAKVARDYSNCILNTTHL